MRAMRSLQTELGFAGLLLLVSMATAAGGCATSERSALLDPDAIGTDNGTLIALSDVRSVAQEMVQSMSASTILSRLRAEHSPLRIAIGNFKQRTSIAIFNKDIFLNRLLSNLSAADASGSYTFLRRESLPAEGVPESPTGADLVLSGELREILHREAVQGGGERESRTVQYTLTLTRVSDTTIAWTDSREIVKEQVTGAVYR